MKDQRGARAGAGAGAGVGVAMRRDMLGRQEGRPGVKRVADIGHARMQAIGRWDRLIK